MQLIDTHCHIHESTYPLNQLETLEKAHADGVTQMICVGTSQLSSKQAVEFAVRHDGVYSTIGVHPHETSDGWEAIKPLVGTPKLVAVGEIGLDYFYTHSPRDVQILALEAQIDMAIKADLPIIFHVREAFDDFWPIFDNFHAIRGELHSFTDSAKNLEAGLTRGLFIGVNGISTFTKDESQKTVFAAIPLDRMLLETDAPFLTPAPLRGKVNEPAYVRRIAEFHAGIRNLPVEEIAAMTTANATALFHL